MNSAVFFKAEKGTTGAVAPGVATTPTFLGKTALFGRAVVSFVTGGLWSLIGATSVRPSAPCEYVGDSLHFFRLK